jgi:hypothetical protein
MNKIPPICGVLHYKKLPAFTTVDFDELKVEIIVGYRVPSKC